MDEEIKKRIIITADDFGISEKANASILKLAKAGKLDRVAVIPHGIFTAQETAELIDSGVKMDAHLNITENILGKRKTKEGIISRGIVFVLKLFTKKFSKKGVYENWDSDIRLFIERFGKKPDGINSHHHVHFFPKYFKIILDLMGKHDISFVRFGKISLLGDNNRVKNILSVLRKKNRKIFLESGQDSTEHLASLDWFRNFDLFISDVPSGTVEITCHPEREEEYEIINKYF